MALSLLCNSLFAQKTPVNESQLKKQANNYFEDEDYANAYLQYSQLLSLYPQDPNYNYRFGACALFSQADKKKPIDYIETAIKQPNVENLAYFILGAHTILTTALTMQYEHTSILNKRHLHQILKSTRLTI